MTSHPETVDEFADLLKQARETLGITQNGMAARIGEALNDPDFDFMQISRWERGANRPDTTRLPAIITAYQLNPTQAMAAFFTPSMKQLKTREALADPVQKRAAKGSAQPPPTPKRRGKTQ